MYDDEYDETAKTRRKKKKNTHTTTTIEENYIYSNSDFKIQK